MFFRRRSMALARLALAWFALTLGVAVAAPMLQPQAVQLVCDAVGGVKLVALQGDGSAGGQVLQLRAVPVGWRGACRDALAAHLTTRERLRASPETRVGCLRAASAGTPARARPAGIFLNPRSNRAFIGDARHLADFIFQE